MKVLHVPVEENKKPVALVGTWEDILQQTNIKNYEMMELQVIEGIGIIANQQTSPGLRRNCIDILGDFILVAITKNGYGYNINGLTDDQLRRMKAGIAYTGI